MSLTVDLHHHVIPDVYWEASNEDGDAAGGITPPRWSLDAAIAYLDEAQIDVAVASISTPGVHLGDDAAARKLARQVNEYLADITRDRPGRTRLSTARPRWSTCRSSRHLLRAPGQVTRRRSPLDHRDRAKTSHLPGGEPEPVPNDQVAS
jgi:hypothetical protein